MVITINGKPITLKHDVSFDFIRENRYFTDADDYSLTIDVPLADCPENIAIFGHLNRKDADSPKSVFTCEIIAEKFNCRGVAAVVGISQSEIKLQFLSGRSAKNYDVSLDETYINELDLGSPWTTSPSDITPNEAWGLYPSSENYMKYIATCWVNNNSESGNIQNEVDYVEDTDSFVWNENTKKLSFQPYLLFLAKQICEQIGFTPDFSAWENSTWKYLLCCNVLPAAWNMPQFAAALPHWSVNEFFSHLENLMHCEFDFDFIGETVKMQWFYKSESNSKMIKLDNVVDDFTSEIENVFTSEENVKPQCFAYEDSGSEMWNKCVCDWLIEKNPSHIKELNSTEFEEFRAEYSTPKPVTFEKEDGTVVGEHVLSFNPCPYIIKYLQTYFIVEWGDVDHEWDSGMGIGYFYKRKLVPIAMFASWLSDEDKENATELKILPAIIDKTDKGDSVFIDCGTLDNDDGGVGAYWESKDYRGFSAMIQNGETGKQSEYLSQMFAAFAWQESYLDQKGLHYAPFVDKIYIDHSDGWTVNYVHGFDIPGFRINQNRRYNSEITYSQIDRTQKYSFSFLLDELPDVRSIFLINGKRYLCEKISATFTENGMSELKKGVFYRIID